MKTFFSFFRRDVLEDEKVGKSNLPKSAKLKYHRWLQKVKLLKLDKITCRQARSACPILYVRLRTCLDSRFVSSDVSCIARKETANERLPTSVSGRRLMQRKKIGKPTHGVSGRVSRDNLLCTWRKYRHMVASMFYVRNTSHYIRERAATLGSTNFGATLPFE